MIRLLLLCVFLAGCDSVEPPVAPPVRDESGQAVNNSPSIAISRRSIGFHFSASDPDGLSKAYLEIDGNRYEEFLSGIEAEFHPQASLRGGRHEYKGAFVDVLGFESTFAGEIEVLPRVDAEFRFRDFFTKLAGSGRISLRLDEAAPPWDTLLVTNAAGWASGPLVAGRYWAEIETEAEGSRMARIMLRASQTDDDQAHFISDGEYITPNGLTARLSEPTTYAIRGAINLEFRLRVNPEDPISTSIEYLTDRKLIDEFREIVNGGDLMAHDPKQLQSFVLFTGNPACGSDWVDRTCSDSTHAGALVGPEHREGHAKWFEYERDLLSSPVVGGNPYQMVRLEVDLSQVGDYSIPGSSLFHLPGENVVFNFLRLSRPHPHWRSSFAGLHVRVQRHSMGRISEARASHFAAYTNQFFGETGAWNTGRTRCTVLGEFRDSNPESCRHLTDDEVQYEIDDKAVMFFTAYVPWGLHQFRGQHVRGLNPTLD